MGEAACRAVRGRRARRLVLAALVATIAAERDVQATPPAEGAPAGPLLAQAPIERPQRQRVRTRAAMRRIRRRRQRRRPRKRPEPRPQAVEVTQPPKPGEKTAWGVDLGLGVQRLHVLYTSDIFGRFAWPGCQERPKDKAEMGHLIAAVAERTKQIHDEGGGVPLVVSAGSMTRPDVLGNFVFKDDQLAPIAVDLIRRVRFDAVAIGMFDFGVTPDAFRRYLGLMRNAQVPLLASNVTCGNPGEFPCSHLGRRDKRYVVVERGGLKIGVFGVVREDLVKRIITSSGRGLGAKDAVESARATIKILRNQEQVDFVVALAAVNVEADTPVPSLDFVRRLGEDSPEVVIADTMFERGLENYMAQIRRASGPVILGTGRFGQTMGEAIIYYRRDKGRVRVDHIGVHRHRVADAKPATEDTQRSLTLLKGMCRELDRSIDGAQFVKPMKYPEFMSYALNVMRSETKAEIALLNESAVADTTFPMSGKLTEEKLLRAIRTETKVGKVWLTGARLKELLASHLDDEDSSLFIAGVTKDEGEWEVNGRALQPGDEYLVATTAFVASGGDLLVDIDEDFQAGKTSLRDMIIGFFKRGGAKYDGDPGIDVEEDFPDLGDEWVYYTGLALGASLSTVRISNGENGDRYFRSQFNREHYVALFLNAKAEFIAESKNHLVEAWAGLNWSKGWASLASWDAENDRMKVGSGQLEWVDEVRLNLTYRSRYLRSLFGLDRWWAPEPFLEGNFITEITESGVYAYPPCPGAPPCPSEPPNDHTYRYMDLIGTVGFGMVLHPLFFPKIGFAMRSELATPQEADVKHGISAKGLYLGYTLRRWKVFSSRKFPLQLESRADFYFTDWLSRRRVELATESKLLLGLWRYLNLSLTHRLYVLDVYREDISVSNDLMVGLNVLLDYRKQTFGR